MGGTRHPAAAADAANLRVEIHPGAARRGHPRHLSPRERERSADRLDPRRHGADVSRPGARASTVRPRRVLDDDDLGHRIYTLETPLQPGDSLRLDFEVHVEPRGFRDRGVDPAIVDERHLLHAAWLPAIGYQPERELLSAGDRRKHGLARAADPLALRREGASGVARRRDHVRGSGEHGRGPDRRRAGRVAPHLDGRRPPLLPLRHRRSDRKRVGVLLGAATRCTRRGGTMSRSGSSHHPRAHRAPGAHGPRASRPRWTTTPRSSDPTRTVISPSSSVPAARHGDARRRQHHLARGRLHLLEPEGRGQRLDLPFAIVAHEMAHQWGVPYALVEGAPVMSESIAWYYGDEGGGARHAVSSSFAGCCASCGNPTPRADPPR